jgi:LPXTG-motif cell wall-anchored protein
VKVSPQNARVGNPAFTGADSGPLVLYALGSLLLGGLLVGGVRCRRSSRG